MTNLKLLVVGCVSLLASTSFTFSANAETLVDSVKALAEQSSCTTKHWKDRGVAPKSYIIGHALAFAKAVCSKNDDVRKLISKPADLADENAEKKDALAWLAQDFKAAELSKEETDLDRLRHVYTLMYGLGMMESSGRYCVGRDKSAGFSTADSAEAGLYQTSWGVNSKSIHLANLFDAYASGNGNCLLESFKSKAASRCSKWDAKTWGEGKGAQWQKKTKQCPAFATDYAAIVVRLNGGSRGEFGPIRKKKVEIEKSCDDLLLKVQQVVEANNAFCAETE